MSKLSEYLKEKRTLSGQSQSDVAKALGYSTSQFISNHERDVSFPVVHTLPILAKLYNVPLEELKAVFKAEYVRQAEKEISIKMASV